MRLFLDTYSLIEIVKGNYNHETLLDNDCFTLKSNIAELYYYILRIYSEEDAIYCLKSFLEISVNFPDNIIPGAMNFRLENRKKHFSYIDCLGYTYAKENNMTFITGDRAFKNFPNTRVMR